MRTVALSRNFYEPLSRVVGDLKSAAMRGTSNLSYLVNPEALLIDLTGRDTFAGNAPTAHGTGTAGVMVSPKGHPDGPTLEDDTAHIPALDPRAFVSGAAPRARVIPFRVTDNPLLLSIEVPPRRLHLLLHRLRAHLSIATSA